MPADDDALHRALAETRANLAGQTVTTGLQTLSLINGGGLIALYTLLGHNGRAPSCACLVGFSAGAFVLGLGLTMVAWLFAFRSQDHLHHAERRFAVGRPEAERFDQRGASAGVIGQVFSVAALVCFGLGGIFAVGAWWP